MSRCYSHFTLADRRRLHQLVERKVPINEMARQLGRHRSTIYREIKRNTFRDRALSDYDGDYGTVANDIPTWQRCHNAISPNSLAISTISHEDALGYRTPTEVFMAHLQEAG